MVGVRELVPELLREIRDEMRGMRGELRGTNERLDRVEAQQVGTNERLDRVERRQVDAEMRFGTAIAELQGATKELIAETKKLGERIDNTLTGAFGASVRNHEARITALEKRTGGSKT